LEDCYNLACSEFSQNTTNIFRSQFEKEDFADVSLACEDAMQIKSHRMVLSASSPFFQSILKTNPQQNIVVFLKGIKYKDLRNILKFLYCGEAKINKDELQSFLAAGEDLQISGLSLESKLAEDFPLLPNIKCENKKMNMNKKDRNTVENLSPSMKKALKSASKKCHVESLDEQIPVTNIELSEEIDISEEIEVLEVPEVAKKSLESALKEIQCQLCGVMIPQTERELLEHVTRVHGEKSPVPV